MRWSRGALRSLTYLDSETLVALAEYHQVEFDRDSEVVERLTKNRSAGAQAKAAGVGGNAGFGSGVEVQTSYALTPKTKSISSKIIDQLIRDGAVLLDPTDETPLIKNQLVEVDGTARITAASMAGKMLHVLRRMLSRADLFDMDFDSLKYDPEFVDELRSVYVENALPPIPILLELTGTTMGAAVYVNVRPDNFLDLASTDRLEGELQVMGSISRLVDGGGDGYFSAEEWLLSGWEHLMRRKLMPTIAPEVRKLFDVLELDIPENDVTAFIAGPAIVIDAVAIY